MSDRFPYNTAPRAALLQLIDEEFPELGVKDTSVAFRNITYSPTINTPGRTFITMDLLDVEKSHDYVYRRLNLDESLNGPIDLTIQGNVTPRKIAETLNTQRGFHFESSDVSFSDAVVVEAGNEGNYRMRAKANSFVWFGSVMVHVTARTDSGGNRILLENGDAMLLESGDYMLMESA